MLLSCPQYVLPLLLVWLLLALALALSCLAASAVCAALGWYSHKLATSGTRIPTTRHPGRKHFTLNCQLY